MNTCVLLFSAKFLSIVVNAFDITEISNTPECGSNGWERLYKQQASLGGFPTHNWCTSASCYYQRWLYDDYIDFTNLDNYQAEDGAYAFTMVWDEEYYMQWEQGDNPIDVTADSINTWAASAYYWTLTVSENMETYGRMDFGGLAVSSDPGILFDGRSTAGAYFAIGASSLMQFMDLNDGIPGFVTLAGYSYIANVIELYVWKPECGDWTLPVEPSTSLTLPPTEIPTPTPTLPPTYLPTFHPTDTTTLDPRNFPTPLPTEVPTKISTQSPTIIPTRQPTPNPTPTPALPPTYLPTFHPTDAPTRDPTDFPTPVPTEVQTGIHSQSPTIMPTRQPTPNPTPTPTLPPTYLPTFHPTDAPTRDPTNFPTPVPTDVPTRIPTRQPTPNPTPTPTLPPTYLPTFHPTDAPTSDPTNFPTPTPTLPPTYLPTFHPTDAPTGDPTNFPTPVPTEVPTRIPTQSPTIIPTTTPSVSAKGRTDGGSWYFLMIYLILLTVSAVFFFLGYRLGSRDEEDSSAGNKNTGNVVSPEVWEEADEFGRRVYLL